jgi:hypothetical protein
MEMESLIITLALFKLMYFNKVYLKHDLFTINLKFVGILFQKNLKRWEKNRERFLVLHLEWCSAKVLFLVTVVAGKLNSGVKEKFIKSELIL